MRTFDWAEEWNGRNQLGIYSYPSVTRLRSCQALNWPTGVNIPSPYVAYLLLFVLRDTYDDASISWHGDMRVLWGHCVGQAGLLGCLVVMTIAGNSWSTCQSRANPSPPIKWRHRDEDMTRITWRQRSMLSIILHLANIWNLSSIQPVLNCNLILTLHATQRYELDFPILCNLKVNCLRILFYCLHSLPSHTPL